MKTLAWSLVALSFGILVGCGQKDDKTDNQAPETQEQANTEQAPLTEDEARAEEMQIRGKNYASVPKNVIIKVPLDKDGNELIDQAEMRYAQAATSTTDVNEIAATFAAAAKPEVLDNDVSDDFDSDLDLSAESSSKWARYSTYMRKLGKYAWNWYGDKHNYHSNDDGKVWWYWIPIAGAIGTAVGAWIKGGSYKKYTPKHMGPNGYPYAYGIRHVGTVQGVGAAPGGAVPGGGFGGTPGVSPTQQGANYYSYAAQGQNYYQSQQYLNQLQQPFSGNGQQQQNQFQGNGNYNGQFSNSYNTWNQ